jgi:polysaccharide pyruvyl transferase WcaK-like protein
MLGLDNNRPVPFRIAGQPRPVPVVNCRLSPRSRPCDHLVWIVLAALLFRALPFSAFRRPISESTPWIAGLKNADIVGDVRGGDSFSDIYGMQRFLHGFFMAWTVLLVKGRMVQFPQTFGPYKSMPARWMARYLLKHSSVVIARDEKSQRVAEALLGPDREVWLSPDVAFSLEAIRPERIALDPPLTGQVPPGVIGLNVNGLMANGGYTRNNMFGLKLDYQNLLPELVKVLLEMHPGELWLVPHTYGPPDSVESDPEACRQMRQALPEALQRRVRIVTGEYDQHEIKGVIGQCDFFIGSRMHACIAALSQGVPCVGVAYSMKFEGVFDSVGMQGWVVDGREVTNEQAVARIVELYRKRDSVREDLAKNADVARARLREIFQRLVSNARKPDSAG